MPTARPLDDVAVATVLMLTLSWGFNQVAIKGALPDIPPLVQALVRSAGALAMLGTWCAVRRVPLFRRDGTLWPGLLAGVLFGLEFLLVYRGLLQTSASRGTIFLYTAPLFVAFVGAFVLPGERLGPWQWVGLGLAFLGVVVAMAAQPSGGASAPSTLRGDALLLLAGAAWGGTTLVLKGSRLNAVAPEKAFAYQLGVSIPLFLAGIAVFDEAVPMAARPAALGWLAYQTIWVVGITFGLWFWLVKHYSASRLAAFTFLTPIFGVAAGHFVLGDAIDTPFAAAAALVVAGLVLVNRRRRGKV